ncbi:MAG TPA: glycoside hydrolase family 15 protein [Acidimicrobiales bacterium]|nr:glycoside hydrolase family 15 protein [Acidimicrobiales bacterium]
MPSLEAVPSAEQAAGGARDAGRDIDDLRPDGFAPIECYAAVGDGRSVALVALDGAVDWWSLPTMDAPPAFSRILDPDAGGHISLRPRGPARARRSYVGRSAVLQTTFTTPNGEVRVTDSANLMDGHQLPWSELARLVEGVSGRVEMEWEVAVGDRFGMARPWATERDGVPLVTVEDQYLGVVADEVGKPVIDGRVVRGSFEAHEGSRHLLGIVSTDGEPLFVPTPDEVCARVEQTTRAWDAWSSRVQAQEPWRDHVLDSARALKLLIYSDTGAIAAAPTTSLPEAVGHTRNYDYRFAWVRDMSFVIQALIYLGAREDSHRSLSWLLSTVRRTVPDLHVFYSLDGRLAEDEADVPLRGYRDSRPVRSGNEAARQSQLGTFGDLIDAVWLYSERGNVLDESTAETVAAFADRVCDTWLQTDSGIWELDEQRHYTSSKLACWLALERSTRLADAGRIHSRNRDRWAYERDVVADWIRERCWSEARQAYTFYADTDLLDAAVLRAGRIGFDRGPQLSSTIDAVREELARGPLVYRYSGMEGIEGTFVACSFWMVEALVYAGRRDEAVALMDELVGLPNDVGLLAEEIDPGTGGFLGNFPLGLSHLALVGAADALAEG